MATPLCRRGVDCRQSALLSPLRRWQCMNPRDSYWSLLPLRTSPKGSKRVPRTRFFAERTEVLFSTLSRLAQCPALPCPSYFSITRITRISIHGPEKQRGGTSLRSQPRGPSNRSEPLRAPQTRIRLQGRHFWDHTSVAQNPPAIKRSPTDRPGCLFPNVPGEGPTPVLPPETVPRPVGRTSTGTTLRWHLEPFRPGRRR